MKGDPILPLVRRVLCGLFEFAILGTALTCAIAALAAQGGRWNDRLDLLTHLAPVWLAGGVVCLLLAAFASRGWRRPTAAALSVAAVLSAGTLMWMDLARLPAALHGSFAPRSLKVIEVNAWARNAEPERVGRWIADEDPDVVVILESTPFVEAEIAAKTHLHIFRGSGAVIATRQRPLSEHVAWEVRQLPGESTEFTWVELRGPTEAPFTLVGVHKGRPIPSRYAWGQDRKLAAFIATQDRSRLIVAGDFNSTQWSFRQRMTDAAFGIERRDIAIRTWPALLPNLGRLYFPAPFLSIDHIYAGSSWKTLSVRRGPRLGSDHYPLVAKLAWAPAG